MNLFIFHKTTELNITIRWKIHNQFGSFVRHINEKTRKFGVRTLLQRDSYIYKAHKFTEQSVQTHSVIVSNPYTPASSVSLSSQLLYGDEPNDAIYNAGSNIQNRLQIISCCGHRMWTGFGLLSVISPLTKAIYLTSPDRIYGIQSGYLCERLFVIC